MDEIVNCFDSGQIENALNVLPETLHETYRRSIEKIPTEQKVQAIRLLRFLVNLDKPLELAAAVDIVTVWSDYRAFAAADRICPQDIVRFCPNLLSIVDVQKYAYHGTSESFELHLAHLSVREYLVQLDDPAFGGVDASVSIARTCLSYLLGFPSGILLHGHPMYGENSWSKDTNFPFGTLAVEMLNKHAVTAEGSRDGVLEMAGQLRKHLEEYPFAPPQWRKAKRHDVNAYASCLHFACYFGLLETTKALANLGADVNYRPENTLSPIGIAVRMNRMEIVRFLLDFGVSPDTTHSQSLYGSVLRCSCIFSLHEVTRLLARKGADLNRLEGDENRRERPLQIAIERVDVKLVRLLLDEGADVNADGGYLGIALQAEAGSDFECDEHEGDSFGTSFVASEASRYERRTRRYERRAHLYGFPANRYGFPANLHQTQDYVDIVATLLNRGADSNASCGSFGTVLQAAARSGVYDIVSVLLQHGADVNAQGGASGHALQVAVERGHVRIVELLLDWGADLNAPSGTPDGNALQTAFRLYDESVIAVLLDRGADVNTESSGYRHALEAAAWKGNVGMVKFLLEKGAHSGNQSKACGPALKAAIEIGDKYIMGLLLDRGAHFDTEHNVYGHALKAAAKKGYKDVVKFLLGTGANFDTEGSVYASALKAAVQEGHEEVVGLLLERGTHSDIEGNPVYGYALRAAVKEGHEAIVGILLKRGENADIEGENYDPYHSALQVAAKEGYKDIVKIFLNKGADTGGRSLEIALYVAATRGNRDLIDLLLESGANVNTQGGSLENALRAAITGGHHDLVESLLQRGADVNASQGQLGNFLAMACVRESPEVMRYLLRYGANATTSVPGFGSVLYNTLYVLIKRHISWGDKQRLILQVLLEAGAEIQSSTSPGYNSLRFAVERGALEPVRLLLNYGADPNILYDASHYHSNHTLLMECLVKSQLGIAQELLQFGADPNGKTSRRLPGQTALHLAMNEDFEEIVRLLLQKGADPDLQSGLPPYTPLQLAVKRDSMKYVRLFLEHGADVEMKGGLGKNITALKLAEKAGNAEIIQLLQQASTQKMSENSQ